MNTKLLAVFVVVALVLSARPLHAASDCNRDGEPNSPSYYNMPITRPFPYGEGTLYEVVIQRSENHHILTSLMLELYDRGTGEVHAMEGDLLDMNDAYIAVFQIDAFQHQVCMIRNGYQFATRVRFRVPRGTQFAVGIRATEVDINTGSTTEFYIDDQSSALTRSTGPAAVLFEISETHAQLRKMNLRMESLSDRASPMRLHPTLAAP